MDKEAVLISIQPKWCAMITQGKKILEVRKNRPKIETPFKCYIYCTKDKANHFWIGKRYSYVDDRSHNAFDKVGNGRIIGEFVCSDIEILHSNTIFNAPALFAQSCMTYEEYFEYEMGETVYLWHISDFKAYDEPYTMSDFARLRGTTRFGEPVEIVRPPQSWCYIMERRTDNG